MSKAKTEKPPKAPETYRDLPVHKSYSYPDNMGTKSWWQKMGYEPTDEKTCTAYARGGKYNDQYYPLYTIEQVQPIKGKAAAERRDLYTKYYRQWNDEMALNLERTLQISFARTLHFSPWRAYNHFHGGDLSSKQSFEIQMRERATQAIEDFNKLYRPAIPGSIYAFIHNLQDRIYGEGRMLWKVTLYNYDFSIRLPDIQAFDAKVFTDESSARIALIEALRTLGDGAEPEVNTEADRGGFKRSYMVKVDGKKRYSGHFTHYYNLDITLESEQHILAELGKILRHQTPRQVQADQAFIAKVEKNIFLDSHPTTPGILARGGLHIFDKYIHEMSAAGKLLYVDRRDGDKESERFGHLRLVSAMTQWAINQYPFGQVPPGLTELYNQIVGEAYTFNDVTRNDLLNEAGRYYHFPGYVEVG